MVIRAVDRTTWTRDAVTTPTEPDGPRGVDATDAPGHVAGADPAGDPVGDLDHLDWRRPHPLTILLELGRAIRSIVVAVVVVSGGVIDEAVFVEFAVLAAPFVAAIGRWYTTRYALDEESVHLHHGLLWRTKQVLPRSNIQNVSTKASLLARMGSVVDLQISDASATGDIRLRVIAQDEADRLTTLLRSSIPATAVPVPTDASASGDGSETEPSSAVDRAGLDAPAPGGPAVERAPLVEPPLGSLLRAELTATSTVLSTVVLVLVVAAVAVARRSEPFDIDLSALPDWVSPWVVLLVGIVGGLLLEAVGVGQRLLALGGFRLWADPDRLRIRVGLLTEARITARRERIQQLRVERDILHRLLAIERVDYETADLEVEGTAGSGYLAPVADAGRWRDLAAEVFGAVQLDESDLRSVSPRTVRRVFLRFVIVAVPLSALVLVHPAFLALPLLAITGGWFYSRARFRVLGYATSTDQLLVRRGVLLGRLTLVQLDKAQIVGLHATVFQRRLGLATLRLSTAGRGFGGIVSLPDLPVDVAEDLLVALARRAGTTAIADTL